MTTQMKSDTLNSLLQALSSLHTVSGVTQCAIDDIEENIKCARFSAMEARFMQTRLSHIQEKLTAAIMALPNGDE